MTVGVWPYIEPGTWSARFWLRGYITAGGYVPPVVFAWLWGKD
jgi:hypothetical protein